MSEPRLPEVLDDAGSRRLDRAVAVLIATLALLGTLCGAVFWWVGERPPPPPVHQEAAP